MKEHVEAGFARIFADDVRGRQVEEGRAQFCADGIHLEQNMMSRMLIRRTDVFVFPNSDNFNWYCYILICLTVRKKSCYSLALFFRYFQVRPAKQI